MKIGSFTLTRDSAALWLPVIGAVITYLLASPPPTQWSYYDWLRAIAAFVAAFSMKQMTSGLPGKNDVAPRVNITKIAPVLLLTVALGSLSCVSLGGARHRAAVSVVSAHAVLAAIQDTEMGLVCGKVTAPAPPACVPVDTHKALSAKLATAFDYDAKALQLAKVLPAGGASPDVASLIGQIRAIVDAVMALIPDSVQRRALAANIGGH